MSPANYLKSPFSDTLIGASAFDSNQINVGANPAINLSTDQLVRMIDPKYEANVIQDLFKQLAAQMYTHHAIFRTHKHMIQTL